MALLVLVTSCKHAASTEEGSDLAGSSSGDYYILKSIKSDLCIGVVDGKIKNGSYLEQTTCTGADAQVFSVQKYDDYVMFFTRTGGKAFDVKDKSKKDGAKIQLYNNSKTDSRLFKLEDKGNGDYKIRAKISNMMLQVQDGSKDSGKNILQVPENDNELSQHWNLVKYDPTKSEKTVVVTKENHVYFLGGDSQREKTFSANLPDDINGYGKATLKLKLSCPSGKCDAWDRFGSFGVYSKDHNNAYLELLRFMTPYGIGGEWSLDVTDFLPLLKGEQKFRLFIDTWVGPGSSSGNGWLVDLSVVYSPGYASQTTALIVPIVSQADIIYGNPDKSTDRSANIKSISGYKSVKIWSLITGHGQGNAENCAEFCQKKHTLTIGSKNFSTTIWRDDCATSTSSKQAGNYTYSRAGWCPGDIVRPWTEDVTSALGDQDTVAKYDVESFTNSCRPEAKECSGCTLGTSCDYDGGMHTEPRYYVTSYVIYKK